MLIVSTGVVFLVMVVSSQSQAWFVAVPTAQALLRRFPIGVDAPTVAFTVIVEDAPGASDGIVPWTRCPVTDT